MGGTGTNKGNQDIQFKFYDPLNSDHFDKRNQGIIPCGIYSGGLLTKIDNTHVEVSPMVVEIQDGTHQARVQTTVAYTVGVGAATPYIVLDWDWQSLSAWYMDIKSVASPSGYQLVVGKCLFAGATLTGFEYPERSSPIALADFLKVLPLETPAMRVRVTTGWCSYGASRIAVAAQESAIITAPTVNPRIDLAYIDSGGNLLIKGGTELASPVPPEHTGLIVLAEILLVPAQTSILESDITDCRPFVNLGGSSELSGLDLSLLFLGAY